MAPGQSGCKTSDDCQWFKEARGEDRYCKPVGSFDPDLRMCTICPQSVDDCGVGDLSCLGRCGASKYYSIILL